MVLVYKVYTDPCEIGQLWCNIAQLVQFKNDFRDGWGERRAPSLSRMGFDRVYPVYYEISFELETENERDL
jgi:hypothetical protein